MKTSDLFKEKTVMSFEVFPPKKTLDDSTIYETLDKLQKLNPDFISVTHGAGGNTNNSKSIEIATAVQNKYNIESVAHLPGINLSKADVMEIMCNLKQNGISNILALRGDINQETKPVGDFYHASDLIEFIKQNGDFNILAACYPEMHPKSKSMVDDILHTKYKVDAGANQLVTQLFFDNNHFYNFREKLLLAQVDVPIEAGIMPVTNKNQIERMVKLCGVEFPKKFMKIIDRYENNPEALRDAGIAYAINQIVDLISHGVDGIHLYTMNKPYIAQKIYEAVSSMLAA